MWRGQIYSKTKRTYSKGTYESAAVLVSDFRGYNTARAGLKNKVLRTCQTCSISPTRIAVLSSSGAPIEPLVDDNQVLWDIAFTLFPFVIDAHALNTLGASTAEYCTGRNFSIKIYTILICDTGRYLKKISHLRV